MKVNEKSLFLKVHRDLIVKTLEELHFEEVFLLEQVDGRIHRLTVSSELFYEFEGELGAWGHIHIQKGSLRKVLNGRALTEFLASDFFIETQHLTKMSDETLSMFLEELHQTIHGEMYRRDRLSSRKAAQLLDLSFTELEQELQGHPKLLLNKGRLGWGDRELLQYAPESGPRFQPRWVGVHSSICKMGFGKNPALLEEACGVSHLRRDLQEQLRNHDRSLSSGDFILFPVHPWQFDRWIRIHYSVYLNEHLMVDLGSAGEFYTPQISIRSLSPVNEFNPIDLKLSLSILNTSCIRGLQGQYLGPGHLISRQLKQLVESDPLLGDGRLRVLEEWGAVHVPHPQWNNIPQAPYYYRELLGAVFRQRVEEVLNPSEKALPVAALLFEDENGDLFSKELIRQSQLSPKDWLKLYAEHVLLPLYHLQLSYGVGLVAHGQNVIMVTEGGRPQSVVVKDLHGDLRLSETSSVKHLKGFKYLDQLPPQHLIHDLFTGHLVTHLRFVSRLWKDHGILNESQFYKTLGEVIEAYLDEYSSAHKGGALDLMRPQIERVLVNRVRFERGYHISTERLKPLLGSPLSNPLAVGGTHDHI